MKNVLIGAVLLGVFGYLFGSSMMDHSCSQGQRKVTAIEACRADAACALTPHSYQILEGAKRNVEIYCE